MSYDVTQLVGGRLESLWGSAVTLVPNLVFALILFVLGLVVASGVGMVVEKIFDTLRLDNIMRQMGAERYFQRAGMRLHTSRFFGQLVFWFIALAFLLMSSDVLGFFALSGFLTSVLNYIPNIAIGILIMLTSVVAGNFARRTVSASIKGAQMPAAHFLGTLAWWVIIIFGLLATMSQLNIAREIVSALVTGLIAMLALAGGLAFGLGGRDYAAHLINKLREHTESR